MQELIAGYTKRIRTKVPHKKAKPYTTYIPKRIDRNQPEIVRTFRQLGYTVQPLHETGRGVFDLIIAKRGLQVFVEIKDGEKPRSARVYTPAQKKWNFYWDGMRCVATSVKDCLYIDMQVKTILELIKHSHINLSVTGCDEEQYRVGLYQ